MPGARKALWVPGSLVHPGPWGQLEGSLQREALEKWASPAKDTEVGAGSGGQRQTLSWHVQHHSVVLASC